MPTIHDRGPHHLFANAPREPQLDRYAVVLSQTLMLSEPPHAALSLVNLSYR
jgi:hypothetical protein